MNFEDCSIKCVEGMCFECSQLLSIEELLEPVIGSQLSSTNESSKNCRNEECQNKVSEDSASSLVGLCNTCYAKKVSVSILRKLFNVIYNYYNFRL